MFKFTADLTQKVIIDKDNDTRNLGTREMTTNLLMDVWNSKNIWVIIVP